MGISSKPPRRKREKREVSGMTALIAAKPAKRSALLRLPHRIYFILDLLKWRYGRPTRYLWSGPQWKWGIRTQSRNQHFDNQPYIFIYVCIFICYSMHFVSDHVFAFFELPQSCHWFAVSIVKSLVTRPVGSPFDDANAARYMSLRSNVFHEIKAPKASAHGSTPPKTNMTMEKQTICRCISYWSLWCSIAMSVHEGVPGFGG